MLKLHCMTQLYQVVVQSVMEWVRTSHESLTGRDGYTDFYKKDVNFYMLGPVGDKIEQWTLKGIIYQQSCV